MSFLTFLRSLREQMNFQRAKNGRFLLNNYGARVKFVEQKRTVAHETILFV